MWQFVAPCLGREGGRKTQKHTHTHWRTSQLIDWYSLGAETEICRELGSIAPRKVFARPESFCTENTFVYYIRNLSGKSLKFLESLWILWKVSGLSWMYLNCLESSGFVWKFSVQSGKYRRPRKLPYFLATYQIVWKVSRMSGKFPDCLESFHIVWKVSR